MENPFLVKTDQPFVAICGQRCGYIQLATSAEITSFHTLPDEILLAARSWAIQLETLGAQRIYWITLSEMLPHLHIHLYPRWAKDEIKGLPLFEQRNTEPQPEWTNEANIALSLWAKNFKVHLLL